MTLKKLKYLFARPFCHKGLYSFESFSIMLSAFGNFKEREKILKLIIISICYRFTIDYA